MDHREPDGARPHDERRLARLQSRPADGMGADAQRLHERELLEGERLGPVELAQGNLDDLPHPPVHVDAEHFELRAAVGPAPAAGDAPAAFQVGLHGAAVAGLQAHVHRVGRRDQLRAQLVPQDARVGEEGLVAFEGVEVGAADPDAADAHQRLVRPRRAGRWAVGEDEPARLLEDDLLHATAPEVEAGP